MIYDWYKILNRAEFEELELVSKEYEVILEGVGLKTVLATKGNYLSLLYEGVFLSIEATGASPFEFDGHAIFEDAAGDVWLGIATS
jgi:hypothetical protein